MSAQTGPSYAGMHTDPVQYTPHGITMPVHPGGHPSGHSGSQGRMKYHASMVNASRAKMNEYHANTTMETLDYSCLTGLQQLITEHKGYYDEQVALQARKGGAPSRP